MNEQRSGGRLQLSYQHCCSRSNLACIAPSHTTLLLLAALLYIQARLGIATRTELFCSESLSGSVQFILGVAAAVKLPVQTQLRATGIRS